MAGDSVVTGPTAHTAGDPATTATGFTALTLAGLGLGTVRAKEVGLSKTTGETEEEEEAEEEQEVVEAVLEGKAITRGGGEPGEAG